MKKRKWNGKAIFGLAMAVVMVFSFQGIKAGATTAIGKVNISMVGKYDSEDMATVRDVDVDNKTIRFKNHATGKNYTLNYDNTSMMYDLYGVAMSPRLLEPGQIVNVRFLKSTKKITSLNVSKDAWYIESTRDHDLVRNDGTAVVKGAVYKIDPRAMVLADNQPALVEDVLTTDSVAVSGVGKDIYSVVVTSGHGYVSLSSDVVENQSLVGAWLELDNAVIHKISPNMLLSAPEGDYNLQIIGNGANYQSKVNVSRNQETVIDTSNVTIERPKEGLVTFEIVPDTAEVFVDGTRMLTGVPQTVQYGYHNLKIMADGYETQTKYLKVGTPKSVISIELEKANDSSDEASSDDTSAESSTTDSTTQQEAAGSASTSDEKTTVSANNSQSTAGSTQSVQTVTGNSSTLQNRTITGHRIYIDEPYGAEVYFDGNYVGMVPTNVTKVSGNHEIILKKDGYETKSYRINIDDAETDLSYQFPALVLIKKEEPAPSNKTPGTISENSSAGDTSSNTPSSISENSSSGDTSSSEKDSSSSEGTTTDAGSEATSGSTKDTSSDSSSSGTTDGTSEGSSSGATDSSWSDSSSGESGGASGSSAGATADSSEGNTSENSSGTTSGEAQPATSDVTTPEASDSENSKSEASDSGQGESSEATATSDESTQTKATVKTKEADDAATTATVPSGN